MLLRSIYASLLSLQRVVYSLSNMSSVLSIANKSSPILISKKSSPLSISNKSSLSISYTGLYICTFTPSSH